MEITFEKMHLTSADIVPDAVGIIARFRVDIGGFRMRNGAIKRRPDGTLIISSGNRVDDGRAHVFIRGAELREQFFGAVLAAYRAAGGQHV